MYNIHKVICSTTFLIVWILGYIFKLHISEALTQNLITFFSITLGFYITSISVLYSSNYIKNLYRKEDNKNKGQTQLHTLKHYFNNSCKWSLFSVIYVILFMLFSTTENGSLYIFSPEDVFRINFISINLQSFLASGLIAVSIVNILFFWLVLKIFFNSLLEEAKSE